MKLREPLTRMEGRQASRQTGHAGMLSGGQAVERAGGLAGRRDGLTDCCACWTGGRVGRWAGGQVVGRMSSQPRPGWARKACMAGRLGGQTAPV